MRFLPFKQLTVDFLFHSWKDLLEKTISSAGGSSPLINHGSMPISLVNLLSMNKRMMEFVNIEDMLCIILLHVFSFASFLLFKRLFSSPCICLMCVVCVLFVGRPVYAVRLQCQLAVIHMQVIIIIMTRIY